MVNSMIGIIVLFFFYESHLVIGATDSAYVTIRGARVSDNGYIPFNLIGGKYSEAVLCHTDDPACCSKDQANSSNWYYPNGSIVESFTTTIKEQGGSNHSFARRRGANESTVRLYRIYNNNPPERGRFRCEIRDAAGNYHQLYVNILNIGNVSITRHNLNTPNGEITVILTCLAEITPHPLPENVPYPSFEWTGYFGQTISLLPSGVAVSNVAERGNIYSSILKFSPLLPHHAGMYTCKLGGNERLSANITVEAVSTMVEDTMLVEQNHNNTILVFGIITIAMVAVILVGAVVILAIPLLRKKLRIHADRSYTVNNDQYHLYNKIFRGPLSTNPRGSVQQNKVPNVPVYQDVQFQDENEWDDYENIEISRCPAYEESTKVLSTN